MLSIGQMAALCQTSVQTLRLYDRVNVLPAAHHDSQTGYRTYQSSQIFQFYLIKYLQKSGLTLNQIQHLLSQPGTKLDQFWHKQVLTAHQRLIAAQQDLQLISFQSQQRQLIEMLTQHLDQQPYLRSTDQFVAELTLTKNVTPLNFPDVQIAQLNQTLIQAGEIPNLEYSFTFPRKNYTTLECIHYKTAFKALISPKVTAPGLQIRSQKGDYLCIAFNWSHGTYLNHYHTLYQAVTANYPAANGPVFERSFPISYDQIGAGKHFITELSLKVNN